MNIFDLNVICSGVAISTKEEALLYVSSLMEEKGAVGSATQFLGALTEREIHSSTALGNLFAVPHGISSTVLRAQVGVVLFNTPVIWEDISDDPLPDEPVQGIFCLAIPESANKGAQNLHIDILSRICTRLLDDNFTEQLLRSPNEQELINLIYTL